MTKCTTIAVLLASAWVGGGCVAPTGEETASAASGLTLTSQGYAWVTSSGATGSSYSSTGGSVTATKFSTGQYQVDFMGHNPSGSNAQVVAYGSTFTHCKLFANALGTDRARWIVRCFDATGALTDSAFNIVTDRLITGGERAAYLTVASNGAVTNSFNANGGSNSVRIASTGVYDVDTEGMDYNDAVHVTAMGLDANRCKIVLWGELTARVNCFNPSGALANTGFSITRREHSLLTAKVGGHALVSNGTLPSLYTATFGRCYVAPAEPFSVAASGNDVIVTLPQATLPPGNTFHEMIPMVTAFNFGTNSCKVVSWGATGTAASARVRCFNNAGTQVNASLTQFTFSFTSRFFPSESC